MFERLCFAARYRETYTKGVVHYHFEWSDESERTVEYRLCAMLTAARSPEVNASKMVIAPSPYRLWCACILSRTTRATGCVTTSELRMVYPHLVISILLVSLTSSLSRPRGPVRKVLNHTQRATRGVPNDVFTEDRSTSQTKRTRSGPMAAI